MWSLSGRWCFLSTALINKHVGGIGAFQRPLCEDALRSVCRSFCLRFLRMLCPCPWISACWENSLLLQHPVGYWTGQTTGREFKRIGQRLFPSVKFKRIFFLQLIWLTTVTFLLLVFWLDKSSPVFFSF